MRKQFGQQVSNRSATDLKSLKQDASLEEVIDSLNDVVRFINLFNKLLSFQSNFDGKIASVEFAAGETKDIQHFLGVIPKFRLILRQEGNGVISDIPSGWTDKVISLKNNGAETVRAILLIARE